MAGDPLRHGRRLIDLDRAARGSPRRAAVERLLAWTAPVRAEHGIDAALPELNGAQRQRRALAAGATAGTRSTPPPSTRPGAPTRPQEVQRHDRQPERPGGDRAASPPRRSCAPPTRRSSSACASRTSSLQTVVSLLNLGGRKAGLAPGHRGRARPRAGPPGDRGRAGAAAARRGRARPGRGAAARGARPSCRWPTRSWRQAQRRGARRRGRRARRRRRPGGPGEPPAAAAPGPAQSQRAPLGPGPVAHRSRLPAHPPPRSLSSRRRAVDGVSCRVAGPPSGGTCGGQPLSDFLTDHGVVVALVCAALAVVYGLLTTRAAAGAVARQRRDAAHLRRRPGGRARLPEPPVHDDRRRRRRPVRSP